MTGKTRWELSYRALRADDRAAEQRRRDAIDRVEQRRQTDARAKVQRVMRDLLDGASPETTWSDIWATYHDR